VTPIRFIYCAVLGAAWGGIALLLGARAFGPELWGGVLASPLVGVAVGSVTQAAFERHVGLRRKLIALGSLYAASFLFGMALGLTASLTRPAGGPGVVARVVENVLSVWWGVTMTGFVLALWPMAFATHWFIEWRASEAHSPSWRGVS
jgi:hypothetical protein